MPVRFSQVGQPASRTDLHESRGGPVLTRRCHVVLLELHVVRKASHSPDGLIARRAPVVALPGESQECGA